MHIEVYQPWRATRQREYVLACLDDNDLTFRGAAVPRFESAFAAAVGARHVVATCNGSVSLFALYRCLFGARGGLVAVPSTTYAATVAQLLLGGFTPVYLPVGDTYQVTVGGLARVAGALPLAGVVVPCLYADAPDLGAIRRLCDAHNLPLVVDAAEAVFCRQGGREVGDFGHAASYSFYANKLVTTGEGGAVTTAHAGLADRVRRFCNQNAGPGYQHDGPGSNFRMPALSAALGLAQLEDAEEVVRRKRVIAAYYRRRVRLTPVVPQVESSEWMPVWRLPPGLRYETFRARCARCGVEVRPTFPPVHHMTGFAGLTPVPLPAPPPPVSSCPATRL